MSWILIHSYENRNGLIIKNLKQFIPQFYLKQMDPISNSRYSSRSQFLFYLSFMRNRATLITLLEETFQQISQFGKPTSANNLAFLIFSLFLSFPYLATGASCSCTTISWNTSAHCPCQMKSTFLQNIKGWQNFQSHLASMWKKDKKKTF